METDKYRILLAEDERMLAEILSDTLGDRGFEVTLAYDGARALEYARTQSFDVIVADVMMPVMDGFTLAKELRSGGVKTPILFLTARCATEDVVKGFELGGNDYLKKPFAIDELIVRIKSLAARGSRNTNGLEAEVPAPQKYRLGKLEFIPGNCTLLHTHNRVAEGDSATVGGSEEKEESIRLSARESAVLEYLCRNMGQAVSASSLLQELWGDDNWFNLRSLNVYITRLRHHLACEPSVKITSIRNVGYILKK